VNILVYNFFHESAASIENFLNLMDSSIHFAISFPDSQRILQKNDIQIAIMNPEEFNNEYLSSLIKKYPRTKFYLTKSSQNIHRYPNLTNTPQNYNLFEIGQIILNQNR